MFVSPELGLCLRFDRIASMDRLTRDNDHVTLDRTFLSVVTVTKGPHLAFILLEHTTTHSLIVARCRRSTLLIPRCHINTLDSRSSLYTMAARPGYEQPDPRNPFANPQQQQQFPQPQPYQQRRRDYDAESDMSDQYASRNGSSARLTGGSPYHDPGQYDSYSEYCGECCTSYFIVLILS